MLGQGQGSINKKGQLNINLHRVIKNFINDTWLVWKNPVI